MPAVLDSFTSPSTPKAYASISFNSLEQPHLRLPPTPPLPVGSRWPFMLRPGHLLLAWRYVVGRYMPGHVCCWASLMTGLSYHLAFVRWSLNYCLKPVAVLNPALLTLLGDVELHLDWWRCCPWPSCPASTPGWSSLLKQPHFPCSLTKSTASVLVVYTAWPLSVKLGGS